MQATSGPIRTWLPTKSTGNDDKYTLFGDSLASKMNKAFTHIIRQSGIVHVKSELHGRCDFVDILPARPGGTDKFQLDFTFMNCDGICDINHIFIQWTCARLTPLR